MLLARRKPRSVEVSDAFGLLLIGALFSCSNIQSAIRRESFDREPPYWEGVNNRSTNFEPKRVTQDFGYSDTTSHFGRQAGEIGGTINPAGEPAYYGFPLLKPLSFDQAFSASGRLFVAPGPGHCLLGFFNPATLNGWRTPNTIVVRINGRGDGFHCHLEYCTSRWRADAGVIGEIERGKRVQARLIPAGRAYDWKLSYDPKASEGKGLLSFSLGDQTTQCRVDSDLRMDGATFTHFGLLPVMKAWDSPGRIWIDNITIDNRKFDLSEDPKWEALNNRTNYITKDTRPRFDFGWSPTHLAGGEAAGELGGLIFRGDCRDRNRLAAYGDRISTVTLEKPFFARGKVSMVRGVTDSTASIGFYNATSSLRVNPSQNQSIPMDFVGVNIEGPSSEGFFFYPVYRNHGDQSQTSVKGAPRIYPDRRPHDWMLAYDPAGADGKGRITVTLDDKTCTLELAAGVKSAGASFNRFGICTPWIDGNSVIAYFDDLEYTSEQDETGFLPLFSEKALKLWRQCGPGRFVVDAGVATGEGGMGLWWYAGAQFTNFVLRGEFVQEQDIADSGVFLRFPDPKNDPWNAVHQGHEMEIGDPNPKDPTWRTGSIYPLAASSKANTRPLGNWNEYEITCHGQNYSVRINGELVTAWTDPTNRSSFGFIGLQNYADRKTVRHRNVRIKEINNAE